VGDFTITTTDGVTRNLYSTLDSGKTVFIDLFYTTCYWCQVHAPVIEEIFQNTGAGNGDIEFWGISNNLFDTNHVIEAYREQYNINNPCAGPWGGGTTAFTTVVSGQNFIGFPTYCVVCPDRSIYFDPVYPPTVTGFDPFFAICAAMVGTEENTPHIRGLRMFPNPASTEITVFLDPVSPGKADCRIIDMSGRQVCRTIHDMTPGENRFVLPLNHLEPGVYSISVQQEGCPVQNGRFVIYQ
jgi:hypothetical protein